MRTKIASHPLAGKCWRRLALHDHECEGRITWEHAIIYKGRKVNEVWAIVYLCAKAHSVDGFQDGGILDKKVNEWIALNRMTAKDEKKYPRFNWQQHRRYLNGLFGRFKLSDKN